MVLNGIIFSYKQCGLRHRNVSVKWLSICKTVVTNFQKSCDVKNLLIGTECSFILTQWRRIAVISQVSENIFLFSHTENDLKLSCTSGIVHNV